MSESNSHQSGRNIACRQAGGSQRCTLLDQDDDPFDQSPGSWPGRLILFVQHTASSASLSLNSGTCPFHFPAPLVAARP
jgi:hypothetical protein